MYRGGITLPSLFCPPLLVFWASEVSVLVLSIFLVFFCSSWNLWNIYIAKIHVGLLLMRKVIFNEFQRAKYVKYPLLFPRHMGYVLPSDGSLWHPLSISHLFGVHVCMGWVYSYRKRIDVQLITNRFLYYSFPHICCSEDKCSCVAL